jgi:hypothetical protein
MRWPFRNCYHPSINMAAAALARFGSPGLSTIPYDIAITLGLGMDLTETHIEQIPKAKLIYEQFSKKLSFSCQFYTPWQDFESARCQKYTSHKFRSAYAQNHPKDPIQKSLFCETKFRPAVLAGLTFTPRLPSNRVAHLGRMRCVSCRLGRVTMVNQSSTFGSVR